MTWVRIESGFLRHRKIIGLPVAAKMLFVGGLCYSAETGTDGHITAAALRVLAAELDVKPAVAKALEEAGLWHKQQGGWDIHDYLTYQPSAAQERQRRQEHADRMQAWRDTKKRRRDTSHDTPRDASHGQSHDTSGDASRDDPVTPSPNPNPNPLQERSSSSRARGGTGCDDDRIKPAIDAIVDHRIARLAAPPSNPTGYRETVAGDVRRAHHQALVTATLDHPDWTPLQLARHVETPTPPPASRTPDPIDMAAAAQRLRDQRLAARARGEACIDCDGVGVTDNGDGTYARCETCA